MELLKTILGPINGILAKIIGNAVGRIILVLLLFGLPGIFTYVIPCEPCYKATMTIGGMVDEATRDAAKAVTSVTGVVTPADQSSTVPAGAQ